MARRCVLVLVLLICPACGDLQSTRARDDSRPGSTSGAGPSIVPPPVAAPATSAPATAQVLMPDLVGLTEVGVMERLAELDEAGLEVSSSWMPQVLLDCEVVPGTIVRQEPAPGTPVPRRADIQIWSARLDLARFRGPCEPAGGELGPVRGDGARLARDFYRFAADPGLGAPFVDRDIWVGIEDGLTHATLTASELADLSAWQLDTSYAEGSGPFSALDVVAQSGGYYEVHRGVLPTCPSGRGGVPPELDGSRAITLTAARDTVSACMQWWGVTLFLDGDRIAGVALRLGSP